VPRQPVTLLRIPWKKQDFAVGNALNRNCEAGVVGKAVELYRKR
jgi:hypothetical protein